MRNFQADVTISTRCGHARHEVVYRVSAWGHVFRVFSPCELMPKKLGCASLGACACQVAHVRALLQGAALPNHAKPWFDRWLINSMPGSMHEAS